MKASIVDLRYNMKAILKALDRNEPVEVLYHGKLKGTIIPSLVRGPIKIKHHPYFGMSKHKKLSVEKEMKKLREERYHDI